MKNVAARAVEVDPRMTAKSLYIKMHQRTEGPPCRTEAEERDRLRARLQHVSLLVEMLRADTGDVFWSTAVSVVDVVAMREVMGDGLCVPLPRGLAFGVAKRYTTFRVSFIDPHAARISAPVVYSEVRGSDDTQTVTLDGRTWECLFAPHYASYVGNDSYLDFGVVIETLCVVSAADQQMIIRGEGDADDDEVYNVVPEEVVPEEVQLRVRLSAIERTSIDEEGMVQADVVKAYHLQGLQDMPLEMLAAVNGMMLQVEKWY